MTVPAELDDDELLVELGRWGAYAADENGDLPAGLWAQIDALLDELLRRRPPA